MILHSHTEQMRSHLHLYPLPTTTGTGATRATATLFLAFSSSPSYSNFTNLIRFSRRGSATPTPPPPDAIPRWDSNAEPIPSGRSSFGFASEVDDDYNGDDGDGFGFDGPRKQRVWWSGYDDEDEDLEFDEGDEEFWGFKVIAWWPSSVVTARATHWLIALTNA